MYVLPAIAVERAVGNRGHPVDVEAPTQEFADTTGLSGGMFDDIAVVDWETPEALAVRDKPVHVLQVLSVIATGRVVGGGVGPLAASDEHLVLRRDHLVEISLHEDDPVIVGFRQPGEQERDDLDGPAARLRQP